MIGYWVRDMNGDTTGTYVDEADRSPRWYDDITNHGDDILYRYFVTSGTGATPDPQWVKMNFKYPTGAANSNQFALNIKSLRIRCWSDYSDANHFTTMWEDEENSPAAGLDVESKVNWNSSTIIKNKDDPLPDFGLYDDNRLPKAVKITIVVQDEKEIEKEREFSTVIYLDNAKR